jgi:RNA polymerase sigma factor (sigma-70 family)
MSETTTPPTPATHSLIAAIRAGDARAASTFVRRYEPMVRRLVRVRGAIRWLQGQLESQDLAQSVFVRVFAALRGGSVRFRDEARLAGFVKAVARNRLRDHVRRQKAARRDRQRTVGGEAAALGQLADPGPSPSQFAAVRELVACVEGSVLPADLDVLRERAAGTEWQDLAATRGTTPEALRLRIQRVRQQIRKTLTAEGAGLPRPSSRSS